MSRVSSVLLFSVRDVVLVVEVVPKGETTISDAVSTREQWKAQLSLLRHVPRPRLLHGVGTPLVPR
jgi:hypothetical protein